MILKFKHIHNLGRFRRFSCSGDQALRRLSLLFGENGRGKTTVASILRSLGSGDARYLHERQMLGSPTTPEIEVLLDAGMAKFDGTSWTLTYSDIEIFDQHFVAENIHVGESVETNNRRGLASVILGQKGAEISRRIKEQDELARNSATAMRNAEQGIEAHIPALRGVKIMTLADFLNLPPTEDIDTLVALKQSEFEAAQRAASLRLQQDILPLSVADLPADFADALSQTLENVSAAAEIKVREHLQAAHMDGAKDWLSDGVEFMSGPTCPVCGRSAEGVDLIAAYKSYFSEEYAALRKRVNALTEGVNDMLGLGYQKTYKKIISSNATALAFWLELIPTLTLPEAPALAETASERTALLGEAMALVFKKEDSLLESLPVTSLDKAREKLEDVSTSIVAYNEAVRVANVKIADLKSKTESAKIADVQTELNRLKLVKARHSPDIVSLVGLRDASKVERERAAAARQAAQEELSTYSRAVVGACEARINELLSNFGVGFRIRGVDTSFPSGTAASTYSIEVNGEAIEAGRPRQSAPSFQTMLSAGDKSALALAFFFAALDQDAGRANKVIFLDDPFNSQDEHRRNHTNKLIHKYAGECAQMLVSSHNPDFLRLVWDTSDRANTKCLKLARENVDDTTIEEWDIEHSTKHPYLRLHDELTQYMSGTLDLTPADVIQKPRPLLEDYIRFRFPNVFQWNHWLGDMILHFQTQGATHPMHPHIQALTDINDYTKGAHHGSAPINEAELRTHVAKTLAIVGQT